MAWFSKQETGTKLDIVAQELVKAGLKHQRQKAGQLEFIETGFSGDNVTVKIRIIALGNDGEFRILSGSFVKIPQQKIQAGYKLVNELNNKYKYVKFAVDDDGDVSVQWDLPDNVPLEAVGKTGVEILLRMFKIIDDAYPEVMKTVWS